MGAFTSNEFGAASRPVGVQPPTIGTRLTTSSIARMANSERNMCH